jgi:ssDNA-specific exonuclease RecJ
LTLSKDGISFIGMLFCVSSQDFPYEIYDEVDVAFNLEINEFLNTKSVQFNIKDIRMSERAYNEQLALESEFIKVKNGESDLSYDDVVPQREDFALLYSFLTKEAREGKEQYSYVKLLKAIKRKYSGVTANYIKIKLMIKIFRELNIISIEEIDDYSFAFKVNYSKNKTNLEKSNILRKLRAQLKN